nr:uncharacterized protein LOC117227201 [Megalopta genalis]
MFTAKLAAHIISKTYKFPNVFRVSTRNLIHNGTALHQSNKNATHSSPKCEEYREKLKKCPKLTESVLCCKRFFQKEVYPQPECKEQTTLDEYTKLRESIRSRGDAFLKTVKERSTSAINELNGYIASMKHKEESQLKRLRSVNEEKLNRLMGLDVAIATKKRERAMSMNDRARMHLETLRCDLIARTIRLVEMAERVERDTVICIGQAESLVKSCGKCKDVKKLQTCLKENADTATMKLEDGLRYANVSLKEIEAYKQAVIKYYAPLSSDAISAYSKESDKFSKYLDDCIFAIEGRSK